MVIITLNVIRYESTYYSEVQVHGILLTQLQRTIYKGFSRKWDFSISSNF